MFGIHNYTSFVLAVLVFQAIPGPGTIAIVNATARNGMRSGGASVLGTVLGDSVFMIGAVAGFAAVVLAHPAIFQALQWFGAFYLVCMGVQLLRKRLISSEFPLDPERSPGGYFRQALRVSLTNPKVMLFFVSFFPLFLRPDASPITLGIMMAHVTLISLAYQGLLVVLGNRVANSLRNIPSARTFATRMAGTALIGFGIKLAADNR
jgi:threonine/homoserine/homoserine lactone efflux protein